MPKVYIAVFRPREGNYYHWAIYVKSDPPQIFEVVGSHPSFERNVDEAKPESTSRHIENIKVGEVNEVDMPEFHAIMSRATVDNDTLEWNCRDYVLETLNELIDECLLDEDEVYTSGRSKAERKYFGPQ